jgi:hypothetical protein
MGKRSCLPAAGFLLLTIALARCGGRTDSSPRDTSDGTISVGRDDDCGGYAGSGAVADGGASAAAHGGSEDHPTMSAGIGGSMTAQGGEGTAGSTAQAGSALGDAGATSSAGMGGSSLGQGGGGMAGAAAGQGGGGKGGSGGQACTSGGWPVAGSSAGGTLLTSCTSPPPQAVQKVCRPPTDNECDEITVPGMMPEGKYGNGFDDDFDGLVDEGCVCCKAGSTKPCFLMPSTLTTGPPNYGVMGWCAPHAAGNVECGYCCCGGEFCDLKWKGECKGASAPAENDTCDMGDLNCDGVHLNAPSGCPCP